MFCLLLTVSFPPVDFGLGLKQHSLVRIKVLTHYLNRYMPLIILEEKLQKLYINSVELGIYRRKRVLREKGRGTVGKEMTLFRSESVASEKVSGEQTWQEHTPSSPFPQIIS